ncbi:MAG TPA: glycosyltransferase family 2 protein [Kiritimatiellia bacterium]|jgi:dolichyl-phosphate beta-glucosyltransferase|nr:glycosyltransferase family 2 protein [Kiritimatiellia bacterium]
MRLTVVIPVYREYRRLKGTLEQVAAFIRDTTEVKVDAILVDDGSPDRCSDVVREFIAASGSDRIRLLGYKVNRGKGYAVRTGVLAAEGDLILMSDADLSTPLQEWVRLKEAVDAGAAIACGSRAVRGAHILTPPPLHRRVLSRVFNLLVHLAGVHDMRDTQCGFKLFRRDVAREVFSRSRINRFAFDVEIIAMARDLGYRVVEVPVIWNYGGHSTVRVFSSGGRMLLDVLWLALRRAVAGPARRV